MQSGSRPGIGLTTGNRQQVRPVLAPHTRQQPATDPRLSGPRNSLRYADLRTKPIEVAMGIK